MKKANEQRGNPNRANMFDINPVTMGNWLEEQKTSIHKNEAATIQHALAVIQNISEALKEKPYVSLNQKFDTDLTLSEFTEYRELGGLDVGDNTAGKTEEELKRIFFLEKIYSKELNRTDAERYAELKILERNNTISPEQQLELHGIDEKIRKEEERSNLDFQANFENILRYTGVSPNFVKKEAQANLTAREIGKSLMQRLGKKEE